MISFRTYLSEGKLPELAPTLAKDKEVRDFLGKPRTTAMIKHPFWQRYNNYEKLYRIERDEWGFMTVDVFPYFSSVHKSPEGKIRPVFWLEFIFSPDRYSVIQVHQHQRDQDSAWRHIKSWKEEK